MSSLYRLIGCLASLLARPVVHAADAWSAGLDVTLEGSASLRGGASKGQALHGAALGHVAWSPAASTAGRPSLRAYGSVLALAGTGPTEKFLGDFLAASNLEGFSSTRLYTWWLEVGSSDWSLRGGALLADEEFTGTAGGGQLINSAFGWPAFISANTINTGPAFYVAAPGARFERRFGERAAVRFGIYDGDSFDSPSGDPHPSRHGVHYRMGGAQGWFLIGEMDYAKSEALRLKLGLWLHTADFVDVRDDVARFPAITILAPRVHAANYGAYATAERTLAGKAGTAGHRGVFARLGLAPSDRNTLHWAFDGGLTATGLLPGRPDDMAVIGLAHGAFSGYLVDTARIFDPAAPAPDFEQTIEVSYNLSLSDRLSLQPDLQYIRHPGGSAAMRDALVTFVRLKASF